MENPPEKLVLWKELGDVLVLLGVLKQIQENHKNPMVIRKP